APPPLTRNGDGRPPAKPLIAIGSAGADAHAPATALLENTDVAAREIAEKALNIAGDICVFTNQQLTVEELDSTKQTHKPA
ncbi:HslU--HslV peptidase proteolytic subunit, partial [Vibrio parahaemolyticus]|nr:HslU--HslV peptidase proteolytic subunit [Vibrio parahaemolyticus]